MNIAINCKYRLTLLATIAVLGMAAAQTTTAWADVIFFKDIACDGANSGVTSRECSAIQKACEAVNNYAKCTFTAQAGSRDGTCTCTTTVPPSPKSYGEYE